MKLRNSIGLFIFFLAVSSCLTSCWRENLSNCWKGDVVLSVGAECFRQNADVCIYEEKMSSRINDMQYYLFDDATGELKYTGSAAKSHLQETFYKISFSKLPFGSYTLAMTANTDDSESLPPADPKSWSSLALENSNPVSDDYFVALHRFEVDCECEYIDTVKLYRANGAVSVRLQHLPDYITRAYVEIDNVASTCLPDTTYYGLCTSAAERETGGSEQGGTVLTFGAFPTGAMSSVIIRLYMLDGEGKEEMEAWSRTLDRQITVVRNQLTGVDLDFNGSLSVTPDISVVLNPDWDGITGGGDVEID